MGRKTIPGLHLVAVAAAGAFTLGAAEPASAQPAAEPRMFTVEVAGSGRDMILIPGLASPGRVWAPTLAAFGGEYRTHVLTLAGFAGQPPVEERPFLAAVVRELADYIRENGLERPVIVGHSLGGVVALDLAALAPDLPEAVVVVDALPFLPAVQMPNATPEAMRAQAEAMRDGWAAQSREQFEAGQQAFLAMMVTDPAKAREIAAWTSRSDPATVAQAMYELFTEDIRPRLARIRVPVLVYGSWVAYGPREQILANFEREYANLPGVRIELSERGRHFLMQDDPEGLHGSMSAFLESL